MERYGRVTVVRSKAFLLWHVRAAECPLPHACRVATRTAAQLLPPTECPGKRVLLSSILRRAHMKRFAFAAVAVCLAAAPAFAAGAAARQTATAAKAKRYMWARSEEHTSELQSRFEL